MNLDLHLVSPPGFEHVLAGEARALKLEVGEVETGSVEARGDLTALYAANVHLRTANRVLVRAASFRATAFHELERGARKVEWGRWIGPDSSVDVRATCRKSRLYHSDAVAQRVMEAIARVTGASDAAIVAADEEEGGEGQLVVVRMFHDRCTISVDSSGALLHRRGYRQAVEKAPLRETMAAGLLLASGW
jgi:putative N6-adenine-specific DNA methylase